ncbi:HK97-gp10 family putative phage morphogenesis protein [Candidatus Contubernalis alkaliaceticus]|uniref:HK97-gp10 family putative phage morphogenesis protein n=1 Tax=Candidatus Contubernalis alkaliaceticus TaxID=338645 RepID=UPI001F4C1116|nr:HK97-gp10 family putative phage morphogenesis protein [Candidatus Contubernalis alkalaceticus]UNC91694.1 HK97 gp10 family phage protein [Candidatus Contubernalis alkalaceticus]
MGGGRIELHGVDELLADIRKHLGEGSVRLEREGLKKGSEIIADEMRSRAPRSRSPRQPTSGSQSWRTGKHAADNIKLSRVIRKDGQKYILTGIQPGDSSKYFYLKFFEFGSSKIEARPWCEPAFHAKKGQALTVLIEEFRKGLGR